MLDTDLQSYIHTDFMQMNTQLLAGLQTGYNFTKSDAFQVIFTNAFKGVFLKFLGASMNTQSLGCKAETNILSDRTTW